MKLVILVVAAILLTACEGAFQPEYQINLTAAEVRDQGVTVTGRTDISTFEWMNITTRACNDRGWEWDTAEQIFAEDIVAMADGSSRGGARAVWFLVTATCRDLIPQDAIDQGPPPAGY
ncbi:MAG: hypothetical protein QNJ89_06600 [Acidimicrobiia bacterium]|nr:hypothetical protein [Acidimicrobiia bacterium]